MLMGNEKKKMEIYERVYIGSGNVSQRKGSHSGPQ